jgi:hypothetical protein
MKDFKADDGIIATLEGVSNPTLNYIVGKNIKVITVSDIVFMQKLQEEN